MKKIVKEKIVYILNMILLLVIICFSSVSLARFVSEKNEKTKIEPGQFYFNCSKVEGETYVLNIKDNETTAATSFTINNYIFDSYSQDDIMYSIELIDVATSASTIIETGVLFKNVLSENVIQINGLVEEKTYEVIVHSTSPYLIEYSFKYYVAKKSLNTFYNINDYGSWIQLELFIGDVLPNENIVITYGNKLTPNPTSSSTENWEISGSHILSIEDLSVNTHYIYEFVELTAGNYGTGEKIEIINNEIIL